MSKAVLITGVAGFIGSRLADYLIDKGYTVYGVDNLSQGLKEHIPSKVIFSELDISTVKSEELSHLEKINFDGIFHFAAKNCISDCEVDKEGTFESNFTGSINFFNALNKLFFTNFVYAESSAVYEGVEKLPSVEEIISPQSAYAYAKYSSGIAMKMLCEKNKKNYFGLRYFNVYGPNQDFRRTIPPVMSAFIINRLLNKIPTIYGDGSKKRDFIYIDDVSNFHKMITEGKVSPGTYNLGYGKNYSIKEIIEMVDKELNMKREINFQPNKDFEAEENLADISLAKKQGWAPSFTIQDGLKAMIKDIKDNFDFIKSRF